MIRNAAFFLAVPILAAAAFAVLPPRGAGALELVWDNGGGNNEWFQAVNWAPNDSPDPEDDLTVGLGLPETIQDVYIDSGGSITVEGGASVVLGDLYTGFSSGLFNALTIDSGAALSSTDGYIGYGVDSAGTATVDGADSTWTSSGSLYVGGSDSAAGGDATLIVRADGTVNVAGTLKLWDTGIVELWGSQINVQSFIAERSDRFFHHGGTLTVDGGTFDPGTQDQGFWLGGPNSPTVTLTAATATLGDDLFVGDDSGDGTLNVLNGSNLSCTGSIIGYFFDTRGAVSVAGTGTTFTGTYLYIGQGSPEGGSTGTLEVRAGGSVSSVDGRIGTHEDGVGTVTVEGADSTWSSDYLFVGSAGTGTLNVQNGGAVSSIWGVIGWELGSQGTVTVDGAGSSWTISGGDPELSVGHSDQGTLTILDGGTVSNGNGYVGFSENSSGTVTVDGAGSTWTNASYLEVGSSGDGTLNVRNGASVSSTKGFLGFGVNAVGSVRVEGSDSTWTISGAVGPDVSSLSVGDSGEGTLHVLDGGTVTNFDGHIGFFSGSRGSVTVNGSASTWTNSDGLGIGEWGNGTLNILNGGAVANTYGYIGYGGGSSGAVTVDGQDSTWTNSEDLGIGETGTGTLDIRNGGVVSSTAGRIAHLAPSNGSVTVDGPGSTWNCSAWLSVGGGATVGGTGTLSVQNGGTVAVNQSIKVWNSGTVNLTGGTISALALDIDGLGGGTFNFTGGRLEVDTFVGILINNGGTLGAGSSAGRTIINGSLIMNSGALEIRIDGPTPVSEDDQLIVSGNATLGGTLGVRVNGPLASVDDYDLRIIRATAVSDRFDVEPAAGDHFGNGVFHQDIAYLSNAVDITVFQAITGDANGDRLFNFQDLVIIFSESGQYYGDPAVTHREWTGGDFTGEGSFTFADLVEAFGEAGQYYGGGPYTAAEAELSSNGSVSLFYDQATGRLLLDPGYAELTTLNIESAAGLLQITPEAERLLSGFADLATAYQFGKLDISGMGELDFGNALAAMLSESQLAADLTVSGSLSGGGRIEDVQLIFHAVPEPSTLLLAIVGLLALLGYFRRRR